MRKNLFRRILSLTLAVVMVLGLFPGVCAAPVLRWERSDLEISPDRTDRLIGEDPVEAPTHAPGDMVRVSIVLEGVPTLRAGYATMDIGSNAAARAYDQNLHRIQQTMARTISLQALNGKALDVVWNLTLVSNIISANIPFGSIEAVRSVPGVRDVVIERRYETTAAQSVEPGMYSSSAMIGSSAVWQTGMTGAGTRVAIVDTGTDTDHQSFRADAYLYALAQNAAAKGMDFDAYTASLDLLDVAGIQAVLDNLNALERIGASAREFYINEKLPFAANYVDYDLTVDHDSDTQGSHGSHVAGIAAANRYIPQGGSFADARDTVRMSGVAPDAQIVTMKVFGSVGGPSDSDYFAAIEDAIWLGCDSINLSLGSGSPGYSESALFEELLDYLATTDTVVVISAGNSGFWAETTAPGHLYNDGISFHTHGAPGTYTNSLAVASVDNDGSVGKYIQVGDTMIVYTETTGYLNSRMSSLDRSTDLSGTEYDYVFVEGFGEPGDYEGVDLTGKIVFCSRGGISFSEKANNAASLGAAAVVICNNTTGAISMDLSDYGYTAPCVSILQTDAEAVKAASTRRTNASGIAYYTGKVTVSGRLGATQYNSDYYTMSTFSSWGVPTSLEMKPEITAPGGLIWSVNGVDISGTAYEMMSGTSMAAPQVTGMAALASEYIRSNDLDEKTGLSVRELAQSLLMSTAQPLREEASGGEYYSILNQGAGLARIDLATTAESYILVDGMADGKVKAELLDDPQREGVYRFSFSIHDLSGEARTYTLRADLFTQDVFSDAGGILYLDTQTRSLAANVEFSMDGMSLEASASDFRRDLNGDGVTNAADADYLLEYILGNADALHDNGDLNGDGHVTSYDAHILLTKLSGTHSVDVPANGSVTVDVCLALTDGSKALLESAYPTGAYIESFVYAEPVNDAEGVQGVTHSIPVLGYYGSWSEPSMYDVGSYLEYTYGAERRAPYLYSVNGIRSNYITINYGDGDEYLFGGNPITPEDEYLPARNAFNNEKGYCLQALRCTLIRNAADTMLLVKNADTGEVYISSEEGALEGAYYHTNAGAWQNTMKKLGLGLGFEGIREGTRLNVSLIAAPELYCTLDESTGDYTADWSRLQEGAYLTTSFTIDNTEPMLKDVHLLGGSTLSVTARDEQYVSAVALMNATGTSVLAVSPANQTEQGKDVTTTLDLSHVYGTEFQLVIYDYAENAAVYDLTLKMDNERPYFTAIDRTNANDDYSINYVGLESDGTAVNLAPTTGREPARAAEYVEGVVFEVSNDNILYVAADEDLFSFTELGPLDPEGQWQIVGFNDLAYDRTTGILYGNFYSERNDIALPYLCTIDMYNGGMEVLGELPIDANSMTIDAAGNFYSTIYGASQLYTYRADAVSTGKATYLGALDGYATTKLNSLAWDHNTDELYWACTGDGISNLLKLDPATAEVSFIQRFGFVMVGLYIAYEPEQDLFAPVYTVNSVYVPDQAETLVNNYIRLEARVLPWNVSSGAVTWTSSDPQIATVDENGVVCGVSAGTAVITAASVLDPSKSADCTVTVTALNTELKALIWDEIGDVWWSSFHTDTLPAYTKLKQTDSNLPVNATMVADGRLYASTLDTTTGTSDLYCVDPQTYAMTYIGGAANAGYIDMAYAPSLGYGLGLYFNYVVLIDLQSGDYLGAWDWAGGAAGDLVGITYYGTEYHEGYGANMDYFLILDNEGNVYLEAFLTNGAETGYFSGPELAYVTNIGKPVDYSYFQGFYYDGSYTYWTRFHEADNMVELIAWDCDNTGEAYSLGHFPAEIWPVGGLYSDAQIHGTMALADRQMTTLKTSPLLTVLPDMEPEPAEGALNAIVDPGQVARPMSSADLADPGEVVVDVTMSDPGTNGIMTVRYDAQAMKLTGVTGSAAAFAWRSSDGSVTLAFAQKREMAADTLVARLCFEALTGGETTVSIVTEELNDGPMDAEESVSVMLPHVCPSENFVDVNPGDWWHEAVDYVVTKGYMNGMDASHYGPGLTMNRAQFVTVLYRMEGQPDVRNTGIFSDVPAGQFYTNAAYWALAAGITTGATATTFNPGGQLTRTELVTFMYRYAAYKGFDTAASADLSGYRDADRILPFALDPWKWSVGNGIVSGMTADTLAPMNLTNRAQAAVIFQRFDSSMIPG